MQLGKSNLKEAVDILEVYSGPGWVPNHKLFVAARTILEHFKKQTVGVRQHTNWDKSIVFFLELNGIRIGSELATKREAETQARRLLSAQGVATLRNLPETMD